MPRASMIIALVIVFGGVVITYAGFAGMFLGTGIHDSDFSGDSTELLASFDGGQGMFTSYSIQVAIRSTGDYDVVFSCIVTESGTYGGVPLNINQNVPGYPITYDNVPGDDNIYSFPGLTAQPLGNNPANMPMKYEITITRNTGSSPIYTVRQQFSNQFLLIPGILILLAGIAILVISIIRKPKTRTEGAAQVIVSPTLGGFGYSGGGSGTGGVAIRSGKKGRGSKKKKKKRPAGRAVPKAGAAACPFCGSMVPSGAYYCPNCYGKIK